MATTDRISIKIEVIKRIEMNSYSATYGSVYLESNEASSGKILRNGENAKQRPSQYIFDEPVPIKRTVSIWCSMPFVPGLCGFYGFKRFDEFANIVSEQHKLCLMMVSGRG
jgi:hypothetical protein